MRKSRFTESQIVVLKEADAGMKVSDVSTRHIRRHTTGNRSMAARRPRT